MVYPSGGYSNTTYRIDMKHSETGASRWSYIEFDRAEDGVLYGRWDIGDPYALNPNSYDTFTITSGGSEVATFTDMSLVIEEQKANVPEPFVSIEYRVFVYDTQIQNLQQVRYTVSGVEPNTTFVLKLNDHANPTTARYLSGVTDANGNFDCWFEDNGWTEREDVPTDVYCRVLLPQAPVISADGKSATLVSKRIRDKELVVSGDLSEEYAMSGKLNENISWHYEPGGTLTISGTGDMTLPEGVKTYPWDGFRYRVNKVVIEKGVTSVGKRAFEEYYRLETVVLPEGVKTLESYCFQGCGKLSSINLPDGLTTVGNAAFDSCTGLTTMIFPDSVTTIMHYAMSGCEGLEYVKLPAGITIITQDMLSYCYSGIETLVIPEGVDTIYSQGMMATNIKVLYIPVSVTNIGHENFWGGQTIHYAGTEAQWNAINMSLSNYDRQALETCTIIFESPAP